MNKYEFLKGSSFNEQATNQIEKSLKHLIADSLNSAIESGDETIYYNKKLNTEITVTIDESLFKQFYIVRFNGIIARIYKDFNQLVDYIYQIS